METKKTGQSYEFLEKRVATLSMYKIALGMLNIGLKVSLIPACT